LNAHSFLHPQIPVRVCSRTVYIKATPPA
jgi:hypothetical protein